LVPLTPALSPSGRGGLKEKPSPRDLKKKALPEKRFFKNLLERSHRGRDKLEGKSFFGPLFEAEGI